VNHILIQPHKSMAPDSDSTELSLSRTESDSSKNASRSPSSFGSPTLASSPTAATGTGSSASTSVENQPDDSKSQNKGSNTTTYNSYSTTSSTTQTTYYTKGSVPFMNGRSSDPQSPPTPNASSLPTSGSGGAALATNYTGSNPAPSDTTPNTGNSVEPSMPVLPTSTSTSTSAGAPGFEIISGGGIFTGTNIQAQVSAGEVTGPIIQTGSGVTLISGLEGALDE
jgi:hypothetical protein